MGHPDEFGGNTMSAIWFLLIGFVLGQFAVVFAGYLGELLKDRREELEESERFRNELHRT